MVEKRRAVDGVGPRTGHDVDDAAGGVAEFGGIRAGQDLELAHGLLAEVAAGPAEDPVVVVEAVHHQVVGDGPLPQHRQPRGLGRRIDRSAGGDAGRQGRQLDEAPAVERQLLDVVRADDGGHGGLGGVDDGRAGLDAHALLDGGDLEREGHLDELADLDRQALAHRRREPLVLGAQVGTRPVRARDDELALAIGRHVTDDVGGTVAGGDSGGGEPAAGGVLDVSTDIRAGRARLRGGCRHGDDEDTDAEQSSGGQVHGRVLGCAPSVTQETLAFPRRLWLELKVRATPADSEEGAFLDPGTSAMAHPRCSSVAQW